MSLSMIDRTQVVFVINQLKTKDAKQRRLMFNEIAKTFCIYCGEIIVNCIYGGKPHG